MAAYTKAFLLLLIIHFTAALTSIKAQVILQGQLKNKEGDPIPAASVEYLNHPIGCKASEEGKFQIEKIEGDTLKISSIGHKPSLIAVTPTTNSIVAILIEDEKLLENVTVKNQKPRLVSLGFYSNHLYYYQYGGATGHESSILIPNEDAIKGYISEIKLRLSKYDNSPFSLRIRLRAVDTSTGLPSDSLPLFVGEVPATMLEKVVRLFIEKNKIKYPEAGVFVTYEWFSNLKNDGWRLGPGITGHRISGDRKIYEHYIGRKWEPTPYWISANGNKLCAPNISIIVSTFNR